MTEPTLSPQQTTNPQALAQQTAARLAAWTEPHPSIRRGRIEPVAMQMAASAPFALPQTLSLTLQVGLWIAALDDLLDEGQADAAAIAGRLRSYEDPAASLGDGDDLAAMLHETYLELSRQPLFPSLAAPWRQALRDHLHGHLQEHGWRSDYRQNPASLPSYADYLAVGCHTIGFPLIPWTFLIAFSDPTAPAHLAGLEEMAVTAGVCLRLANDIRSYERELAEGKINAIVILSWTAVAEAAQRQAEEHIVAEIEAGLASLRRQRQALAASCDLPSAAILGMAETGCRFYHRRDFHVAA
ncbi:MAG: terpene synthase family protein [Caldilineales bacterium]|nr:terpene synthase family protein [Caldilineales bacterium]MCW5858746.1 hypothetical protein [Caldilineales bacterium]